MDRKKNRKRYRALAVLTTGIMVLSTGAGVRAEDSVNVLALKEGNSNGNDVPYGSRQARARSQRKIMIFRL